VVVPEPFVYFVQAGAFTRTEDAEQQRAKLAMIGQTAKITEREQAGRVVYRVRLGPFPVRNDADALQSKLQEQGVESQIVRVEKP
jgi:cell division protein FtsN